MFPVQRRKKATLFSRERDSTEVLRDPACRRWPDLDRTNENTSWASHLVARLLTRAKSRSCERLLPRGRANPGLPCAHREPSHCGRLAFVESDSRLFFPPSSLPCNDDVHTRVADWRLRSSLVRCLCLSVSLGRSSITMGAFSPRRTVRQYKAMYARRALMCY